MRGSPELTFSSRLKRSFLDGLQKGCSIPYKSLDFAYNPELHRGSLADDWKAVGRDMRSAMRQYDDRAWSTKD